MYRKCHFSIHDEISGKFSLFPLFNNSRKKYFVIILFFKFNGLIHFSKKIIHGELCDFIWR